MEECKCTLPSQATLNKLSFQVKNTNIFFAHRSVSLWAGWRVRTDRKHQMHIFTTQQCLHFSSFKLYPIASFVHCELTYFFHFFLLVFYSPLFFHSCIFYLALKCHWRMKNYANTIERWQTWKRVSCPTTEETYEC